MIMSRHTAAEQIAPPPPKWRGEGGRGPAEPAIHKTKLGRYKRLSQRECQLCFPILRCPLTVYTFGMSEASLVKKQCMRSWKNDEF